MEHPTSCSVHYSESSHDKMTLLERQSYGVTKTVLPRFVEQGGVREEELEIVVRGF